MVVKKNKCTILFFVIHRSPAEIMYRCDYCFRVYYGHSLCRSCSKFTSPVIVRSPRILECTVCGALFLENDAKKCCSSLLQPHVPTNSLMNLIEEMEKKMKEAIELLKKSSFTDIPPVKAEEMEHTYLKASTTCAGLPECYEKRVLEKHLIQLKEGYHKWMLISRVFHKLSQKDFLSQIEKVSQYIDSMNENDQPTIEVDVQSDRTLEVGSVLLHLET